MDMNCFVCGGVMVRNCANPLCRLRHDGLLFRANRRLLAGNPPAGCSRNAWSESLPQRLSDPDHRGVAVSQARQVLGTLTGSRWGLGETSAFLALLPGTLPLNGEG